MTGSTRPVDLGAEAQLKPGKSWEQSQAALYKALGAQLRTLWTSNGKPHANAPAIQPLEASAVGALWGSKKEGSWRRPYAVLITPRPSISLICWSE